MKFSLIEYHKHMLGDRVRLEAYREAIKLVVKQGDIVVDIGTGTGILAMFAVQAGASKVYAIENSSLATEAAELIRLNEMSEQIQIINERSDRVVLPELADVVISEILGHFGVDENMAYFLNDARKRFLKEDGIMLPSHLKLFIQPVSAPTTVDRYLSPWTNDHFGVDLSAVRPMALNKRLLLEGDETVHPLAPLFMIADQDYLDFVKPTAVYNGEAIIETEGRFDGLVGYFASELTDGFILGSSPGMARTSWRPSFFPCQTSLDLVKDDLVKFTLKTITQGESVFWDWQINVERDGQSLYRSDLTEFELRKEELLLRKNSTFPVLNHRGAEIKLVLELSDGNRSIIGIAQTLQETFPDRYRSIEKARETVTTYLGGNMKT